MKSSINPEIKHEEIASLAKIYGANIVENAWAQVKDKLGIDLEQTARETKAIQRRRAILSASDLLRLILMYALSDWSLRLVGGWAMLQGIGYLSDVAILKHLRTSRAWLALLVGEFLQRRCEALKALPGLRLRLIDATCIQHPGSQQINWRVHLSYDLGQGCVDGVELTNVSGGESLQRFTPTNHEIWIADGAYPTAKGMGPILLKGAGLIVRSNWRNVPLYTENGQRFSVLAWLKTLQQPGEQPVWFETPQGRFQLRLIAAPLPPEKAEQARRKAKLNNQRKQRRYHPTEETLFAAGFILLLTNLPVESWPIQLVLGVYTLRWQIELLFKRYKSLLQLDHLRSKDPRVAQTYLFAKLLIALFLDDCLHQTRLQQPEWFESLDRPVSVSRLFQFHLENFRLTIYGSCLLKKTGLFWDALKRYFCDSPRARSQQLAWARALIQHLSLSFPIA